MSETQFSPEIFRHEGEQFLRDLVLQLKEQGIDSADYKCDHLCYRVEAWEQYEQYREYFKSLGVLLTETPVNGRPICTFRLQVPFCTEQQTVWLLELPAPKAGSVYSVGFEHAEFVISESFEGLQSQYPHLQFHEAGTKTLNPELVLKLSGCQAKFHHHSLERVIEIEEAEITDVIFDFDGTLIRSREHIYEINRIVFSRILGREVTLQESIKNFHAEFGQLFAAFGVSCAEKQKQAIDQWGEVSGTFKYELFEGVPEMLTAMKRSGLNLHLWTARDESSALRILRHHNLEPFFTTFSYATVTDSKPHANSLRCDWKNKAKNQIVMIGDTVTDMSAATNIKAIKGAALWDENVKPRHLVEAGAELNFYKVHDIQKWFCV